MVRSDASAVFVTSGTRLQGSFRSDNNLIMMESAFPGQIKRLIFSIPVEVSAAYLMRVSYYELEIVRVGSLGRKAHKNSRCWVGEPSGCAARSRPLPCGRAISLGERLI